MLLLIPWAVRRLATSYLQRLCISFCILTKSPDAKEKRYQILMLKWRSIPVIVVRCIFSLVLLQERRFAVLVSALLSSQTKDEVTHGWYFLSGLSINIGFLDVSNKLAYNSISFVLVCACGCLCICLKCLYLILLDECGLFFGKKIYSAIYITWMEDQYTIAASPGVTEEWDSSHTLGN